MGSCLGNRQTEDTGGEARYGLLAYALRVSLKLTTFCGGGKKEKTQLKSYSYLTEKQTNKQIIYML